MVSHMHYVYSMKLHLNKANTCDNETLFVAFYLTITNGIVASKIYYEMSLILKQLFSDV